MTKLTLQEIDATDSRDLTVSEQIEGVILRFLEKNPHASRHPTATVRGIPLIIDPTRIKMEGIVGCTGTAYPTFADPRDDVPSGYAFHAVHVDTQREREPYIPAEE